MPTCWAKRARSLSKAWIRASTSSMRSRMFERSGGAAPGAAAARRAARPFALFDAVNLRRAMHTSRVPALELAHERHQRIDSCRRHGAVQAAAHAAVFPVALQIP